MMYHSNVPVKERYSVFKEAIICATLLDRAFVVEIYG